MILARSLALAKTKEIKEMEKERHTNVLRAALSQKKKRAHAAGRSDKASNITITITMGKPMRLGQDALVVVFGFI